MAGTLLAFGFVSHGFIIGGDGTVLFRFASPLIGSDYDQRFRPELEKALGRKADADLAAGGFSAGNRAVEAALELRYFGQEHALEVPFLEGDDLAAVRTRFDVAPAHTAGSR